MAMAVAVAEAERDELGVEDAAMLIDCDAEGHRDVNDDADAL